ncbi:MAG: AMP-binding protein [Polyangiales bacterium]
MTTPPPPAAPPARGNHIEQLARALPDGVALREGEHALTWSAWNDQANRLADALAARGLGAGDRVALRMLNRIEWFVVDAALSKLGAVRVAISQRLKAPEVRHIVVDSGARAIFVDDEDVAALLPAFHDNPKLVLKVGLFGSAEGVDAYAALLDAGAPTERFSEAAAQSVVYTSGTTGAPKGVARTAAQSAEKRELVRRLGDDLRRSIPYQRGDRNLLAAPLNHAAGPSSALATHARGGSVVLLRRFDPEEALRLIAKHRITVSFLVPTMLNRIVNLPEEVRAQYDVSSMRIITTGASVCPADLKRKVTALFGPVLYDSYGATECGLVTIFTPADLEKHADSCGRLLDGIEVRVADDAGNALPRGEVGTIYIRSGSTIAGYLGHGEGGDDFTADGFFTAGDVGKLDDESYLYILDRKKDMIIAGGVNLYPAEIEAALRAHPAVLDAAVFGVPHPDLGEQPHAVCERVPGKHVEAQELADFVAARLAKFKLPRAITFVDELPRNAAGKVLKRDLRAPFWAGSGRAI